MCVPIDPAMGAFSNKLSATFSANGRLWIASRCVPRCHISQSRVSLSYVPLPSWQSFPGLVTDLGIGCLVPLPRTREHEDERVIRRYCRTPVVWWSDDSIRRRSSVDWGGCEPGRLRVAP